MADVFVKYVGKKPLTIDSVCGTGAVWNGAGDIQAIPAEAAEKLSKYHPDQWQIVAAVKKPRAAKAKAIDATATIDIDDDTAEVE